ncbi:hypothetical protein BSKO_11589 [Bryopsis sp. KO-2023]|nr:hypothetical protein BSKO_11589 [Bryopsis sp. KO-2023]
MDWTKVTIAELVEHLRQVDWKEKPRSPNDFFGRFGPVKNQKEWQSRVKCNVYYYRSNYLLVLVAVFGALFLGNPLALIGILSCLLAFLTFNDSLAGFLSEHLTAVIKSISPELATKFGVVHHTSRNPRSGAAVRICGAPRWQFQLGLFCLGFVLMSLSSAHKTMAWATILGNGLWIAHASCRVPKLKARVASAWHNLVDR